MEIHIGTIIRDHCRRNLITPLELAKLLEIHYVSIYNIFRQADMRASMLLRISLALKHDFFQYYQSSLPDNLPSRHEQLTSEHKQLLNKFEKLQSENELLKKLLNLTPRTP